MPKTVTGGGTTALARKYGDYVSPDEVERRGEHLDHREAEVRQQAIGARTSGGRRL